MQELVLHLSSTLHYYPPSPICSTDKELRGKKHRLFSITHQPHTLPRGMLVKYFTMMTDSSEN